MNKTKINELTNQISKVRDILNDLTMQLEAEKDKPEKEKKELSIDDRWKPKLNEIFFRIESYEVSPSTWTNAIEDKLCFNEYNTWETLSRVQKVEEKTRLLWIMEQIHDILCPDYTPNWKDEDEYKYNIYFSFKDQRWMCDFNLCMDRTFTYFDTDEHAEQACKILNDMGVKPV